MSRKTALEIVRIEFAKHGEPTEKALRMYVEGPISMEAYNKAAKTGLAQHNRIKKREKERKEKIKYQKEAITLSFQKYLHGTSTAEVTIKARNRKRAVTILREYLAERGDTLCSSPIHLTRISNNGNTVFRGEIVYKRRKRKWRR